MYLLLFYKLLLFLLLSLIDILNKLYLLPNYLHNYLSLYILSKIGPAFIKISQVSQNNSIDRSNFETINEYLNILDNIYSSKIINTVDLNTEQNIDIIKPLSIASGSMAYVYEIRHQKKKSVLKQYSANQESINSGIDLFKLLIKLGLVANNTVLFKIINYDSYHQYFLDQIKSDLEVENMKTFQKIFKNISNVNIPKCYYYDKQNIIMSYEKGINLFKFLEINKSNDNIIEQTYLLLFACIYRMCQEKTIHGDFHAGNLLFYIENDKVKLSIVDFGIVLKITSEQREFFINNFKNIENYYSIDRKKIIGDFFWYFGHHNPECTKEKFINIISKSSKTKLFYMPSEKFVYIPEGGVDILLNDQLLETGFKISQEYYNMMITLEILMNKITKFANFNKKFNKKLKQFIIDNDFVE